MHIESCASQIAFRKIKSIEKVSGSNKNKEGEKLFRVMDEEEEGGEKTWGSIICLCPPLFDHERTEANWQEAQ